VYVCTREEEDKSPHGIFQANLHFAVIQAAPLQELERGDSALRSLCSVQGSLVMHAIHAFGSDEQRARWLPDLAQGAPFACAAALRPAPLSIRWSLRVATFG
jgi:alkylation response protein AidB-like acyl-CoA dehydrogenase